MKKRIKICACQGKMCSDDCYSCYYGKNGWYLDGDKKWYCNLHDMPVNPSDCCDDYKQSKRIKGCHLSATFLFV